MDKISKYIQHMIGQSKNDPVYICQQYYLDKVQQKPNLNPNIMLTVLNKLSLSLKLPGREKHKIRNQIKNIIFNIRIQSNHKTKMAPIFHPENLIKLIKKLWTCSKNKSIPLLLAKRQAALQALICLVTGRRWTDVTRIKWDTMESIITPKDHFIKFLIPVSKTNQIGTRIETITLRQHKYRKDICPINMILQLKTWVGQPTNGFVFKCLAPNTKWTIDPINKLWSSYRCKGHWGQDDKQPCLGHTSSTHSFGYLKRFAKRLQWKTLPTKHTFRRTCLIIAKQLDIDRAQINEGFGWVPQSDMIRHYTADHDSTTIKAPAVAISYELDKPNPFKCVNTVQFTCI